MGTWFDPAQFGNGVSFTPLPAEDAAIPVEEALDLAGRRYYVERWPDVRIATQYGLYDDGGRGTSLVFPPDYPQPPSPPNGPDSLPRSERRILALQREEWHREAEKAGEIITHRNRLVWLVAFIGIVEQNSPMKKVRVKVIDTATRRVWGGYQSPIADYGDPR